MHCLVMCSSCSGDSRKCDCHSHQQKGRKQEIEPRRKSSHSQTKNLGEAYKRIELPRQGRAANPVPGPARRQRDSRPALAE